MAHTDRHTPPKFQPTYDVRNFSRLKVDAAELHRLRVLERRHTRAMLRTATHNPDADTWPAWRNAASWQLPSY